MLVLISGAEQATAPVTRELERLGATVTRADADVQGEVDAYVQLPTLLSVDDTAAGDSLVERVGRFLSDGLLTRFHSAAAALPHLSAQATVVLVGGNTPVPGTGVDDQAARSSLLRVLAHALRAEGAPGRLRVRVLDHGTDPVTIARCAMGEDVRSRPSSASVSGPPAGSSDVDLSYADWRTEILGLATVEF